MSLLVVLVNIASVVSVNQDVVLILLVLEVSLASVILNVALTAAEILLVILVNFASVVSV